MLMVIAVAGIVYVASLSAQQVGTWMDEGFYISLARSLGAGHGMRLIHLLTQPVTAIVPPVYPLLLSPVAWLFPDSVTVLQWVSLLLTLATLPLFYRLAVKRLPQAMALAALVVFALNPYVVSASTWVMSEAPFVFFLVLSILLVEKLIAARPTPSWPLLIGAGLSTAAVLLVRYFGLPLVGAIVLYVVIRLPNRRAVAFVAVVGLGILVPTLGLGAEAAMARYGSVATSLLKFLSLGDMSIPGTTSVNTAAIATSQMDFSAALLRNTQHLITAALSDVIIPLFGRPQVIAAFTSLGLGFVPIAVQALISGIVIVGYGLCLRQQATVAEWGVPAYAIFLLVITQGTWPDLGSAYRYAFPLIPFVLVYFLRSVYALDHSIRRQTWWPHGLQRYASLIVIMIAGLLLLYLGRDVQGIVNPLRNRLPDVALGADWINDNTDADARVLAETPRVSAIYARRTMVPYPDGSYEARDVFRGEESCTTALCVDEIIDRYQVNYVLVTYHISPVSPFHWSSFTKTYVMPLMTSNPERFRAVYVSPDGLVRVYRVNQ